MERISSLCGGLAPIVDPIVVTQKVVAGVYPGVTTSQLDELAAETCASCSTQHPDFGTLAARIAVSDLQKNTMGKFSDVVQVLSKHVHPKTGLPAPLVSEALTSLVAANAEAIDARIVHERDFAFEYFGFKTLEKSYLLRLDGKVASSLF